MCKIILQKDESDQREYEATAGVKGMFLKDIDDWIRATVFSSHAGIKDRRRAMRRRSERRKEPRSDYLERRMVQDRRYCALKRK